MPVLPPSPLLLLVDSARSVEVSVDVSAKPESGRALADAAEAAAEAVAESSCSLAAFEQLSIAVEIDVIAAALTTYARLRR